MKKPWRPTFKEFVELAVLPNMEPLGPPEHVIVPREDSSTDNKEKPEDNAPAKEQD